MKNTIETNIETAINNLTAIKEALKESPLKNFGPKGIEKITEKAGVRMYLKKGEYEYISGYMHYICINVPYIEKNGFERKNEYEQILFYSFDEIDKKLEELILYKKNRLERIKKQLTQKEEIEAIYKRIIEDKKLLEKFDTEIREQVKNEEIKFDTYYLTANY